MRFHSTAVPNCRLCDRWILLAAALVLLLAPLGCEAQSVSNEVVDDRIDRDALLRHVEILASDAYQGRKAGTEGATMAIEYIRDAYDNLELAAACPEGITQTFPFQNRDGDQTGYNLIARIPGTSASSQVILLTAHFDHLGTFNGEIYNGADDNASGTAALLELARAFSAEPLQHDLIVAALDAEEIGLVGARAFVDSACGSDLDIALNVNLDMVSRSEAGELYAAGTSHYTFLRPPLENIAPTQGMTLLFGHDEPGMGLDDWTSASDHAPFHAKGIPFIYFGVEDHPGYHNPSDDFEEITPAFFHAATLTILDGIRALDAAIPSFPQRPD